MLTIKSNEHPDSPTLAEHLSRINAAVAISSGVILRNSKPELVIAACRRIQSAIEECAQLGVDPQSVGIDEELMARIRRTV